MQRYSDDEFIGEFDDVAFDEKFARSGVSSINAVPAGTQERDNLTVLFPEQVLSRRIAPEFQTPRLPLVVKDFDRPGFSLTTTQWVLIGAGILVAYTMFTNKPRRKVIG